MQNSKRKILFIDYISPDAHIHSTKPQIDSLTNLGYNVYCVFREGYFKRHGISNAVNYLEIPSSFYPRKSGHLLPRLFYCRILLYIWKNVKDDGWDYTIFQYYELFSLALIPFFSSSFIVNHNTISKTSNPLICLALKSLGKRMRHVVFNSYQAEGLKSVGVDNVYIIPMMAHKLSKISGNEILKRYNIIENKYIFCPSSTSSNPEFISTLCENYAFLRFLNENQLKFVLKCSKGFVENKNPLVVGISEFLPEDEYNRLLKSSSVVLLAYKSTFTFRVSGVLLECIENDIKCIINDIPSFRAYGDYIKTDIFFADIQEMLYKINMIIRYPESIYYPYNTSINIEDAWSETLK